MSRTAIGCTVPHCKLIGCCYGKPLDSNQAYVCTQLCYNYCERLLLKLIVSSNQASHGQHRRIISSHVTQVHSTMTHAQQMLLTACYLDSRQLVLTFQLTSDFGGSCFRFYTARTVVSSTCYTSRVKVRATAEYVQLLRGGILSTEYAHSCSNQTKSVT